MLEMLARSEKNDSKNGNPWGGEVPNPTLLVEIHPVVGLILNF